MAKRIFQAFLTIAFLSGGFAFVAISGLFQIRARALATGVTGDASVVDPQTIGSLITILELLGVGLVVCSLILGFIFARIIQRVCSGASTELSDALRSPDLNQKRT